MRSDSVKTLLTALLVGVLAAALYCTRLADSPIYMMHDELKFVLQAQSIAAAGRSMTGEFLPVYFTEPEFPAGRDPVAIYATALALRVLPLSESSARLPTAFAGALDVVLVFLLTRRLFGRTSMALVAAALMAFTPAHFVRSRLALSPHYTIPFVLAWLFCLEAVLRRRNSRGLIQGVPWPAVGAGALLGLGMYAYLAGVVMMPLYLVVTLAVLRGPAVSGAVRPSAKTILAGFLVSLLPMLAWHVAHPERVGQIVSAYRLFSGPSVASASSAVLPSASSVSSGGGRSGSSVPSVAEPFTAFVARRLDVYWSAFSPDFLFVEGAVSLIDSTRHAGVFPMALVVLLPAGLWYCLRGRGGPLGWIVAGGLLTAPFATVLSGHLEMNRIPFLLPFGALTATYGVVALLSARRASVRWVTVGLVVLVPLQFVGFYRDYMGPYRVRSSAAFGGDLRSALEVVLGDREIPAGTPVLVSRRIPYAERYWRFYAIKEDREDLLARVAFVDEASLMPEQSAAGAYLVCQAQAPSCTAVEQAGWAPHSRIAEPDGHGSFIVYRKVSG